MIQPAGQDQSPQVNIQNLAELKGWLFSKGIDFSQWGRGATKAVACLWNEIVAQETYLQNDPPRRVGSVAKVIVRQGDDILVEIEQLFGDNQTRRRNLPPSEKMKPEENYRDAAVRCLYEELGVDPRRIEIISSTYQQREVEAESFSYPGLRTRYILHIVEAKVDGLPDTDFWTIEPAQVQGDSVKKHHWAWRTQSDNSG